jgi:diaminopimelate decarboxylase
MNRSNINAFELSLLTDPVLIPSLAYELSSPMSYFLTGNLCVANELLTPRMIHFRRPVIPGDILAFCNTAPYIMDFAESRTLHQPVARKIAGYFEGKKLTWSLDDEYQPRARANL